MLKVETTDGHFTFGELIDPDEYGLSELERQPTDWIDTISVPNVRGNSFLYGWLESIGQSDHVPYFWSESSDPLKIRLVEM